MLKRRTNDCKFSCKTLTSLAHPRVIQFLAEFGESRLGSVEALRAHEVLAVGHDAVRHGQLGGEHFAAALHAECHRVHLTVTMPPTIDVSLCA